jgi:thiol:disulfide interchange protein
MAGSAEIAWNYDYADGLAKAKAAGKPIMIDVFATWCGPCKILDEQVFSRADVVAASTAFVTIRIDGDKHPDTVTKLNVSAYPTVLFLNPEGKEIGRSLGAVPYQDMLSSMAAAQKKVGSPK